MYARETTRALVDIEQALIRVCTLAALQVPCVLVEPCNHLCLCFECAGEMAARYDTAAAMRQCPVCKSEIDRVRRVFLP
jgi:hypothetical protein